MRRQDGQRALRVALEVKIRFGPLCVRIYDITYILIQKKKKKDSRHLAHCQFCSPISRSSQNSEKMHNGRCNAVSKLSGKLAQIGWTHTVDAQFLQWKTETINNFMIVPYALSDRIIFFPMRYSSILLCNRLVQKSLKKSESTRTSLLCDQRRTPLNNLRYSLTTRESFWRVAY